MVIGLLLDVIDNRWPKNHCCTVRLQVDRTLPLIHNDDPVWKKKQKYKRPTVTIVWQPDKSPDLNALQLGIWRGMQAKLKGKPDMTTKGKIRAARTKWFDEIPLDMIESCFCNLQTVLKKVQDSKGGNKFDSLLKRKPNDNETETEEEQDGDDTESDDEIDTKPPALQKPRFSKQVAYKRIGKTAGHV